MGLLQQCRDEPNLDIFLLYHLRHKMPIKTVLFANKRDRDCRWLCGRFYGKNALIIAGKSDDADSPRGLQRGFDRNRY